MDKEIIIVRENVPSGELTATYFGGHQEYDSVCRDSEEVQGFIANASYRVHLCNYETGEIEKFFYTKDKSMAKFVMDFLVLDGEEPENIGIRNMHKTCAYCKGYYNGHCIKRDYERVGINEVCNDWE